MKTLILQTSPMHTASTLLVNALYGLIPELFNKKIIGVWDDHVETYFENILVIKNHNVNIDELMEKYKQYHVVFVCSERKEKNYLIDEKYKTYENVVVFDFDELNETSTTTLDQIVDCIYNRVKKVLPDIKLDPVKCMKRIKLMNCRYEEIKNKPFDYIDDFFEIHGSHRNRK